MMMNEKFDIEEVYRYERKFFVHNKSRKSIERMVMQHPAFFSETFPIRYVNNIYFDYPLLNNLVDNIEGNQYRSKHRIRWYGDLFGVNDAPKLEEKIKNGLIGTKKIYALPCFDLRINMDTKDIQDLIQQSEIDSPVKLSLNEQRPVLLNRYRRSYFESNDMKFRLTVDDEQSFYKINTFNNSFLRSHNDTNNIIIELKYSLVHEEDANQITNQLPFRNTKSSKYTRGMSLVGW